MKNTILSMRISLKQTLNHIKNINSIFEELIGNETKYNLNKYY